jgi:hypothetical protein
LWVIDPISEKRFFPCLFKVPFFIGILKKNKKKIKKRKKVGVAPPLYSRLLFPLLSPFLASPGFLILFNDPIA